MGYAGTRYRSTQTEEIRLLTCHILYFGSSYYANTWEVVIGILASAQVSQSEP